MSSALDLLKQGRKQDLWQRCCGFIDLSLEEFMVIQKRLLLEQIELLKNCELGRKVMRGAMPRTMEEFRAQVPLTTYADYAPYLPEKREDVLPLPPIIWQRTSGRSSQYSYKWVPVTKRLAEEMAPTFLAIMIFATCKERGELAFKENEKFLYLLAPPPYASGSWARWGAQEFPFTFMPPLDEAEDIPFEERIQQGFKLAFKEGTAIIFGISSILVAVGRQFSQGRNLKDINILSLLSEPGVLLRLSRALLKSKLARRPMLPRDVWSLKGLIAGGTDTAVYREKIKDMWGRYPLDLYGCTESLILAMQTWDYQGMTFVPYFSFFEFIPEDEHLRAKADPSYQPSTVLLNEVMAGQNYEIVCTNFHGGPFTRYRLGDIIRITSLRNEKLNIDIPQMIFYSRADDVIDFTYTSFTEKSIWQAIENSGLDYIDWVARKEIGEKPILHIYLETKEDKNGREEELTAAIDQQLGILQEDYSHLEKEFGFKPFKLTLLPCGAFQEYIARQRAAGAELAHLKPPRINPSDIVIKTLLGDSHPTSASSG
ncbi:GH3 auxin-responsive promoter family protein [Chloroflexota bacterium]